MIVALVLNSTFAVLDFVLRRERSLISETAAFRAMKHNQDLVPQFRQQVENTLNAFGRFEPIVYDTQGFADDGVDIVVRVERERVGVASDPQIVGLQVKSYGDFRRGHLLRELKAQHDDARRKVKGLKELFIVLCSDQNKDQEMIRRIASEYRSASETFVIDPTLAHGFINMPLRRVEGVISRAMEAEDIVFRRALETVEVGRDSAGVLAIYFASRVLAGDQEVAVADVLSDPMINQSYAELRDALEKRQRRLLEVHLTRGNGREVDEPDDDYDDDGEDHNELLLSNLATEDLIANDLELINNRLINMISSNERITVRLDDIMPLVAMLADARVRYDLSQGDLAAYGLSAMGLLDGR